MVKQSGKYTFYCICGYSPKKTSLTDCFYLINEHNKVCNETLSLDNYEKEKEQNNKNVSVK